MSIRGCFITSLASYGLGALSTNHGSCLVWLNLVRATAQPPGPRFSDPLLLFLSRPPPTGGRKGKLDSPLFPYFAILTVHYCSEAIAWRLFSAEAVYLLSGLGYMRPYRRLEALLRPHKLIFMTYKALFRAIARCSIVVGGEDPTKPVTRV